ncbi:MAG: bifunctional folylpolyglutamate synthase/dihydrofolate synthase [Ignavibacteriales bacterium]|nr:bifunctional folylpolyglutamate synthase/dihydrofolate synthase [Ignavibacteriales bacterium]
MNIDTALEKIYSLKQFHIKLGLDNITDLLNYLGNPEKDLRIIHVAGSNGKGSTCSFLSSILQELGYKVGLYTSPHFIRFNERIRVNGKEIDDNSIISFLEKHKKYINDKSPTFFEITTALAYEYFSNSKVDFTIMETGLGGRLDATNTIIPLASVITSISLEHSHILGDTLEKIASEKAGIIKKEVPTFIGNLPSDADKKIEEICLERNSKLYRFNGFTKITEDQIQIKLSKGEFSYSKTGLIGKHQLSNSALAIKTIDSIFDIYDYKYFTKGIDNVIFNTGIQGRYEKYGKNSNIIFDAAHNVEGIDIFLQEFINEYLTYSKRTLIFGAMKDKSINEMLIKLNPFFHEIFVTSSNYERAANPDEIKSIAENNQIDVIIETEPVNLIKRFERQDQNECLVVLGSIYLLGQIKQKMVEQN